MITTSTLHPNPLAEIESLKQEVRYLREQLEWFKRQVFGKKSEKIIDQNVDSNYLPGFEEFVKSADEEGKKKKVKEHSRNKKNKSGLDKLEYPDNLPVEQQILDLPESEKICSQTGLPLIVIGQDVTRKLAKKPVCFYIKEIIRIKYALPKGAEEGIKAADLPSNILPRCHVDNSVLVDIVCMKFADHLPLYRISEIYRRDGINITRQALSQWVLKIGQQLEPLYKALEKRVLNSENIFMDETPVDLLEKGKGKAHQAIMWAVSGGKCSDPADRIYRFSYDRKVAHAHDILSSFKGGVLHSDKYRAYVQIAKNNTIIWCPCWAHIRRKFVESDSTDGEFRSWVLRKIKYLYMLDRVAWNRSENERLRIRQEKSGPIIDEIIEAVKEKLIQGHILPRSKYKEALGYLTGLIPYLKNYTLYAYARLDNNVVERAIRPITIGRKNWLFFGSEEGGKSAATLLSLIQTCRAYSVNPREYLEDIFQRLMDYNITDIDDLLPGNWKKRN